MKPSSCLAGLLGVALAAGALSGAAAAAEPSPATTTDACISSVPEKDTTEPVSICYSLFKPAGADGAHKVPLVFHSHGWGGSRTKDAAAFSRYLTDGYGVLSFDQRGFGESGGKARVENPAYEGRDVLSLVALVAKLPWVQLDAPGDPRMAAIGGSYGGGYQFLGAFHALTVKGKPLFDALAPEITWNDVKDSLAPQEVVRTAWVTALQAAGANDEAPEILRGVAVGAATGTWPTGPEPVAPDLDAVFLKNGPKWHVSKGRKLDIPVLFGQGITDNLFNLNQGLKNWSTALTPAARTKSIFVGYNGGHTLPSAVPPGYGVAGDPCSEQLGGGSFADLAKRFFDEELKGKMTGLTGFGRYHLATADGACVTKTSVAVNASRSLGTVTAFSAAGPVQVLPLADGPVSVAGVPRVSATITSTGLDNRSFFALAVGTSLTDAKVVQNNTMPLRVATAVTGERRTFELPGVAVDVPAGQKLFLLVAPLADMFGSHIGRTPGTITMDNTVVQLPQLVVG